MSADNTSKTAPVPGVTTVSLQDIAAPDKVRHRPEKRLHTLLFHPERCSGCGLCQSVCGGKSKGTASPGEGCMQITPNPLRGGSFAIFCQHCLTPRCLAACPQGAISRRKDGIVRINKALCINCGLCQASCTEAAPIRTPDGTILKCDLCDGAPQCVAACPQKALEYTAGKKIQWIGWLRWPVQMLSFLLLVVVLVGTFCSFTIAAFDISCPTGVLQNIFSAKTLLLTSLAAGMALIVLAIVAGRAFCGWVCPFGFVLDIVGKTISLVVPPKYPDKTRKSFWSRVGEHSPKPVRSLSFLANRNNKYGVLAGSLVASGAAGNQAFCTICPIGIVCRSYGIQSTLAGAELAVIPMIAAMETGAKRSWCRYFCPVGATFALFVKISPVYIEIGSDRCKKFSCKRCVEVCPMGIVPEATLQAGEKTTVSKQECIMCLRCVDICPHKAAKLRFGRQKTFTPAEVPACTASATPRTTGGPA